MGPSWGQGAPSWSQVGLKLEPIGPSSAQVKVLLAEVGPMLRPCWIEAVHLDSFGSICKMCKLPHSLLNCHASAPGVWADFFLERCNLFELYLSWGLTLFADFSRRWPTDNSEMN